MKHIRKRTWSILLTLVMLFSLVPGMGLTAYAAETTETLALSTITGLGPSYTFTGTDADAVGYPYDSDGWAVGRLLVNDEEYSNTDLTFTAKNGKAITKVVLGVGFDEKAGDIATLLTTDATGGVTFDGNTVTVLANSEGAASVNIAGTDTTGDIIHFVQFNTATVYLVDASATPDASDTIPLTFSSKNEGDEVAWDDSIAQYGYWMMEAQNSNYYVCLAGGSSTQAAGTYSWDKMFGSLCYLTDSANNNVFFTDTDGCTVTVEDNGDVNVSGLFLGNDGKTYAIDITYVIPAIDPANAIEFTFSSKNEGDTVQWIDNCAKAGWWQITAENDEYIVNLSNDSSQQAAETYAWSGMGSSYCWIKNYLTDMRFYFTDSTGCTVTVNEDGSVNVSGMFLGDDGKTYAVDITYIPSVDVTDVTLNTTEATISVGGVQELTATVSPDDATDQKVQWSVAGTNADAVKLYTDENCTTEVGTDATETLTVYAKGISAGSATVTATSNADSTKTATCTVTVNPATPTVAISPEGAGTVTAEDHPDPELSNSWQLTAKPAAGYVFKEWTYTAGGSQLTASDNPLAVDKGYLNQGTISNLTAVFEVATLHTHDFTYNADGATITATCGDGCDITEGLSITLTAPEALTYDGEAKVVTLSTGYNTIAFPGEYEIKYTKNGRSVDSAIDAGSYTAKLTIGDATASLKFTVAKADGAAAVAPEVTGWTSGSIDVTAVEGQEYVVVPKGGTPDWTQAQTGTDIVLFTGLTPATEYDIYTRVAEAKNTKAGEAAGSSTVTLLESLSKMGELKVGETITVVPDPANATGLSYQWCYVKTVETEDGSMDLTEIIPGATDASYKLTEADYGKTLRVVVSKAGMELSDTDYGPVGGDLEIIGVTGVSGTGEYVWTKGSTDDVVITVKLTDAADDSFDHFVGVIVDETELVRDMDYTVKEGSTIVTLKAATVQKLGVGKHNVDILFDNGIVSAELTVKAAEKAADKAADNTPKKAPNTGDDSAIALWTVVLLAGTAGAVLTLRRKSK